ncbi:MAG: SWIB/MDM2 domain-containing protein [Planctomycetota bacterium]
MAAKKKAAKRKPAKKKAAKKKSPARKPAKKKAAKRKPAKKKAAKKKSPARKPAKKKAAKRKPAKKKAAKKKTARKKRKPNPAFMKAMNPSEALAAIVGKKPLPRTQVTKKIWAYIKKNDLQDAKNRRNINADDKLKPIFGRKKTVSMFEMTKLINNHLS